MPKLRFIDEKIGGEYVRLELWYNTRERYFEIKGLEPKVISISEFDNKENTEAELLKRLDEAIKVYHERIKTERDLIVITFRVSAETKKVKGENGKIEKDKRFPEKVLSEYGSDGHGFNIGFERVSKVQSNKIKVFKWKKKENGEWEKSQYYNTERNQDIEIEFTEDRYAFFERMAEKLKEQALKIALFLSQDSDDIVKMIERKKEIELGPGEQ